ncbi:MAG: hypothetical protein EOP90_12700 [Lysobacteraceae bacterium]|nr:MAG: hypothetical protein EOP90_12700 [Xanthomonadaceae bacterium]
MARAYSVCIPLGLPDWIAGTSGGSVLLEDGSIVRTGTRAGDHVARWKPVDVETGRARRGCSR